MGRLRVAVIGLRHAANDFHLPGLASFPDVELSLCDIRPEALAHSGDTFGVPKERRYLDCAKLLRCEDPAAVYVLMAQYAHPENPNPAAYFRIVGDVIAQRRHILVEKPLAMTLPEAEPLAEAAEKAGIVSMVSVNRRFYPLVTFCRKAVEAEGPITTVHSSFYKSGDASPPGTLDWLTGDMIHSLDLVRFLMGGEIVDFHSTLSRQSDDAVPTAFHALLRFSGGGTGIFSSNVRAGARRELYQIHGNGISAYIESNPEAAQRCFQRASLYRASGDIMLEPLQPATVTVEEVAGTDNEQVCRGFTLADRYFIDCVKSGTQPHCSFADACQTVACCERILKGSESVIHVN